MITANGRSLIRRYAAAAGVVTLSAVAAELLYRLTESPRLSVVFLASVLVTAYLLGSGPAYFAAALAFLAYNFYLVEPRFELNYGGPEDIVTLAVFLIVAMLTGRLTGRVKDQAKQAEARARATQALFDATRAFSGSSDEVFIRGELARSLALTARGEAFVREQARTVASPPDLRVPAEVSWSAMEVERKALKEPARCVASGDWTLRALSADGAPLGVSGWRGERAAADEPFLEILAEVGAAAVARARLAAGKAEAETRAQTENLRNALLSSISHDLRTPLAAILASASSLSEFGESFDAATRKDLSATIQQEAERLDAFVANLLAMTRLEAGALTVQRIAFSVPEIIERAVGRRPAHGGARVDLAVAPNLPEALGDPVLFEQAFWNVFENAVRYAPRESPISVRAAQTGKVLEVSVEDQGPGVPPEDLPRVFDKFFRSAVTAETPGTGLGLSITKGLITGMGGAVAAGARPDGARGLRMTISLPAAP